MPKPKKQSNGKHFLFKGDEPDNDEDYMAWVQKQEESVDPEKPKFDLDYTPETDSDIDMYLLKACFNGDKNAIKRALDLGADINCCWIKDDRLESPLLIAAYSADIEVVRLLIKSGADTKSALYRATPEEQSVINQAKFEIGVDDRYEADSNVFMIEPVVVKSDNSDENGGSNSDNTKQGQESGAPADKNDNSDEENKKRTAMMIMRNRGGRSF